MPGWGRGRRKGPELGGLVGTTGRRRRVVSCPECIVSPELEGVGKGVGGSGSKAGDT